MSQGRGLLREIEEVANEDVDQDVEIVRVEILVRAGGGEDEVQELESEQL